MWYITANDRSNCLESVSFDRNMKRGRSWIIRPATLLIGAIMVKRVPLWNDIRVNPAECSRYSCRYMSTATVSCTKYTVSFTLISLWDTIRALTVVLDTSYASRVRMVARMLTKLHPSRYNQLLDLTTISVFCS